MHGKTAHTYLLLLLASVVLQVSALLVNNNRLMTAHVSSRYKGVMCVVLACRSSASRKVRQERIELPIFPMLLEVIDNNQYQLHTDVATSVDALLAGRQLTVELR